MNAVTVALKRWLDSSAGEGEPLARGRERVDWVRCVPFILLHAACLLVFAVGWSWTAVGLAAGLYGARMFFLTAFYHRYFSHRTFKTSRAAQFLFALAAGTCVQRGPLWWAAHHRHHHKVSDEPQDPHSPSQHGFLWSHMGWFMSRENFPTRREEIRDFDRYPELRFLDRFDVLAPALLAAAVYGLGEILRLRLPALGTSGPQLLVWTAISTVALFHGTSTINSLAHLIGRRRYRTGDTSRNSLLLTLLTMGEGWHNNHHHYQSSSRLGHRWWEIDPAWYLLVGLSWMGLIWDLRPVPAGLLARGRREG